MLKVKTDVLKVKMELLKVKMLMPINGVIGIIVRDNKLAFST